MIVVHTTVPIDSEAWETATDAVEEIATHSREASGTRYYHATADRTASVVRFFEVYESATAAERHTDSDAYEQFVRKLPRVADGDIETIRFETDDLSRATFPPETAVASLDGTDDA